MYSCFPVSLSSTGSSGKFCAPRHIHPDSLPAGCAQRADGQRHISHMSAGMLKSEPSHTKLTKPKFSDSVPTRFCSSSKIMPWKASLVWRGLFVWQWLWLGGPRMHWNATFGGSIVQQNGLLHSHAKLGLWTQVLHQLRCFDEAPVWPCA